MRPADIDRYFRLLSERIDYPVRVTLTGGAVAVLDGSARVTEDLDFQITLAPRDANKKEHLQSALDKVSALTGIASQYDENIESWGSISWPRTKRVSKLYKRFKSIDVQILDPLLWSIGKLSRYLASDIEDLVLILKEADLTPQKAAKAWGEALGRSPLSSAQPLFRNQVLHFIQSQGRAIWGKSLNVPKIQELFLATARQTGHTQKRR